jgi:hypothetical protein
MDREGYGGRVAQSDIDRLVEDCRTLDGAGIERIATGWDQRPSEATYLAAERAALHAVETSGHGVEWDETRNRLLGLTERGTPLISWRAEHGVLGHKAEDALLGAALALVAQPKLSHHHAKVLLRPMAEAVPWLLTDTTPS